MELVITTLNFAVSILGLNIEWATGGGSIVSLSLLCLWKFFFAYVEKKEFKSFQKNQTLEAMETFVCLAGWF